MRPREGKSKLTQILRVFEEEGGDGSKYTGANGASGRGAVAIEEVAHGHIVLGG